MIYDKVIFMPQYPALIYYVNTSYCTITYMLQPLCIPFVVAYDMF